MVIDISNYYFHGLGGMDDDDNQHTSYYSRTNSYILKSWILKKYKMNHTFDMDIVSIERLIKILKDKSILPPEKLDEKFRSLSTIPHFHEQDEVCIATKKSNMSTCPSRYLKYSEAFNEFIYFSMSILIDPSINRTNCDNFFKESVLISNHGNGAMYGECRVIGGIPSEYFSGISLPVSLIPEFNNYNQINNINDYISSRIREIEVIRNILNSNGFDLPIIDTMYGEVIDSEEKVLKLINNSKVHY